MAKVLKVLMDCYNIVGPTPRSVIGGLYSILHHERTYSFATLFIAAKMSGS